MQNNDDHFYMGIALEQAKRAFAENEVPIGAIIVAEGKIVSSAYNQTQFRKSPIAHAETIAIENAARKLSRWRWRLEDTILYTTLEPCPMCAGAILLARIKRLVYALKDEKAGACGTVVNLLAQSQFNHQVEIVSGIREEESLNLLRNFFRVRRKKAKYKKK